MSKPIIAIVETVTFDNPNLYQNIVIFKFNRSGKFVNHLCFQSNLQQF